MAHRRTATLIGFCAVLMWSLLALFTAASGAVPPFQLTAMSFAIGGSLGLFLMVAGGRSTAVFRQAPGVWITGICGLFGYHFFYFTALRLAPPVEAGLIAYLWPLLIVVFSALLPGESLRGHHLLGAALGLAGTAIIVIGDRGLTLSGGALPGYLAALACAVIWSAYSVGSRRYSAVPTDIVAGFCLATAVLSAAAHLALEETVWPVNGIEWLAVAGLGLMPVGAAFYVWDYGVKHGDIQVIGASAYAAPLLSTFVLIAAGFGVFTWSIGLACLLITGGAVIAARDLILDRAAK